MTQFRQNILNMKNPETFKGVVKFSEGWQAGKADSYGKADKLRMGRAAKLCPYQSGLDRDNWIDGFLSSWSKAKARKAKYKTTRRKAA